MEALVSTLEPSWSKGSSSNQGLLIIFPLTDLRAVAIIIPTLPPPPLPVAPDGTPRVPRIVASITNYPLPASSATPPQGLIARPANDL